MKVLIESYNNVMQNDSGGVQVRIRKFIETYQLYNKNIKLFDKWNDKLTDFDILHIFKVNIDDYLLFKLAKKNDIPIVISSVVPNEKKIQIILNRVLCKVLPFKTTYWIMNEMLMKADAIISQTQKEAEFINKYYKIPKKKIHVIPNGVNISIDKGVKDEFTKRTGITGKFVLQVGRFDENKNQLNVIKAMANSDIPVVFIGAADAMNQEYYEMCKRNASSNIHFLGWIKHDDPLLASAYQNAHVVILPSYKEIFGNSLIEGGAAGANLIATKELPIDEWGIKDICKCIDPYDIKDIKNKIIQAYSEPLNPNTSKRIHEKFSWERVIEQHIDVYNKIKCK